ncbi:MAG: hypothetical protein PHY09_15930 [Desulfuromonadaceae bacterium]|nr:hypothetical protein [Desulfuromonadaceae bacterium]MDD5105641.1 hypothetical protein [Desulfuromonadaceae bacterium]
MNKISTVLLVAVLTMLCAACTSPAGDGGVRSGKIGDQRLGAYTQIRRLTYRNVCGSGGPLTVCVDRITLSDSAVLVEARIKNAAPERYVQSAKEGTSILLADKSGRTLAWDGGYSMEYPGMKEKSVSFRMEGHFSEEPHAVMVNRIRKKTGDHADQGISVVALLEE